MDTDFLAVFVRDHEDCPSAERALRFQLGIADTPYRHPKLRRLKLNVPRINDPCGLIRSLYSTYTGGGISNDIGSTLSVTNSTFSGNLATSGSGIYNYGGSSTVTGTIVANSPAGSNCSGQWRRETLR